MTGSYILGGIRGIEMGIVEGRNISHVLEDGRLSESKLESTTHAVASAKVFIVIFIYTSHGTTVNVITIGHSSASKDTDKKKHINSFAIHGSQII